MTGTTLITGADGYVGRRLAAALLEDGDDDLVLAMRAGDTAEFAGKRSALERELPSAALDRISFTAADLRSGGALDQIDRQAVTRIVHAAAVTRFNVEWDVARSVNVEGTARLVEFAGTCPKLRRLAYVSTLYSAGQRSGEVAERQHGDVGFANHYEWSKWAAEQAVLSAADLPVSVLRLPTIIADGDNGQVTQYNAFHNTLKLVLLWPAVPGAGGSVDAGEPGHGVVHHLGDHPAAGSGGRRRDLPRLPGPGGHANAGTVAHHGVRRFRAGQLLPPTAAPDPGVLRPGELRRPGCRGEPLPRRTGAGVVGLGLLVRDPAVLAEDIPQRRTAGRLARLPGSGPEHLGAGGVRATCHITLGPAARRRGLRRNRDQQ